MKIMGYAQDSIDSTNRLKKNKGKKVHVIHCYLHFFYFPRYPVILASLLTDMLETYISNQRIMRKVGKRAIEATAIYPSTV